MTTTAASPPLTFPIVDGIAHACATGAPAADTFSAHRWSVEDLGPLVELANLCGADRVPKDVIQKHVDQGRFAPLERAVSTGLQTNIFDSVSTFGFFRGATNDANALTAFKLAARRAAQSAGFSKPVAYQLAAAIGELESNLQEHSAAPETGVLYFNGRSGTFEFGVTDRGIGVMASLRQCPEHASLHDHGTALKLAVSEGGSRHGTRALRGNGFKPIFVGLANHGGFLRFRSGDHAYIIDGRGLGPAQGTQVQKAMSDGFVVSISCFV